MSKIFDIVGILDSWKEGDIPANQQIDIIVSSYSKTEQGYISLTPRLASDSEIDYEIDSLINELEILRRKAKKNIHDTNSRIKRSIQKKNKS